MSNVNEKIAREICGWKKKWIDAGDGDKYWQWEDTEYFEAYSFEPSSNIAHAMAALESLPNNLLYESGKCVERYFCKILFLTKLKDVVCYADTLCRAICLALTDERVRAAVKEARK